MRLWHKDLISVLPRKQLIAQWRELCAIVGSIDKHGTPNHPLVNKVLDYPPIHFFMYTNAVLAEMKKRGYKVSEKAYTTLTARLDKCINLDNVFDCHTYMYVPVTIEDIYKDWHNIDYLRQCYYNLQEKYFCGMISQGEWIKIEQLYKEKIKE